MKRDWFIAWLQASLLAFAVALSGVGCIITAFPFAEGSLTPAVWLTILVWTSVCGLLFGIRHGGKIFLGISLAVAVYAGMDGEIIHQGKAFLYHITSYYDSAYGWGAWFAEEALFELPLTWIWVAIGCLVSSCVCYVVRRKKWSVFAVAAGVLPLTVCCVVTDTVPAAGYLFVLICALALLVFTQGARRRTQKDGNRMVALMLIPVLLAGWLLFSYATPAAFEEEIERLRQIFPLEMLQGKPGESDNQGIVNSTIANRVDLSQIGAPENLHQPVMDVLASITDTIYLRGQAFDSYDGTGWFLGDASNKNDLFWPHAGIMPKATVEITTRTPESILYAPFYTGNVGMTQKNGVPARQINEDGAVHYRFSLYKPVPGIPLLSNGNISQSGYYLTLPLETQTKAWQIVNENLLLGPARSNTAANIQNYVRSLASYDLNAPAMPPGQEDFALWFLQEGDRGYCVHFASAAVVLLRAAGIPARYVTGYVVDTTEDVRRTVTRQNAHAWVEYLDEDRCWKLLEVTPGFENTQQDDPFTQLTEATEPTQETTQPTQSTQETTQPTQTQETNTTPTEPTDIQQDTRDLTALWNVLNAVVVLVLAFCVFVLPYFIRRSLRRKKMYFAEPNRQAAARWQYILLLARRLRLKVPLKIKELAEKAAFSQYEISPEELKIMDTFIEKAHRKLRKETVFRRIWLKLIFALG